MMLQKQKKTKIPMNQPDMKARGPLNEKPEGTHWPDTGSVSEVQISPSLSENRLRVAEENSPGRNAEAAPVRNPLPVLDVRGAGT